MVLGLKGITPGNGYWNDILDEVGDGTDLAFIHLGFDDLFGHIQIDLMGHVQLFELTDASCEALSSPKKLGLEVKWVLQYALPGENLEFRVYSGEEFSGALSDTQCVAEELLSRVGEKLDWYSGFPRYHLAKERFEWKKKEFEAALEKLRVP